MLENDSEFQLIKYFKNQLDKRRIDGHECNCMSFWSDCDLFPPCAWLKDVLTRGHFWFEE